MDLDAAEAMAMDLMAEHGLDGWWFMFDSAKSRFGACHWGKKLITLSESLTMLNDESHVRETVLHEIAHALVPPPAEAHGWEWKSAARSLGIPADRCYGAQVKVPPFPWRGVCPTPGCDRKVYRRERPPVGRLSCGSCSSKFDPQFLFVWERGSFEKEA